MKEVEFLVEKDLPYFREKAEKGEVVILELSPKELLQMDLTELLKREEDGEKINLEELQEWLEKNRADLREKYQENMGQAARSAGRAPGGSVPSGSALAERLLEVELNAEKRKIIEEGINRQLPEPALLYLLNDYFVREDTNADEMRKMLVGLDIRKEVDPA